MIRDETTWQVVTYLESFSTCVYQGNEQVCHQLAISLIGTPLTIAGASGESTTIGSILKTEVLKVP